MLEGVAPETIIRSVGGCDKDNSQLFGTELDVSGIKLGGSPLKGGDKSDKTDSELIIFSL